MLTVRQTAFYLLHDSEHNPFQRQSLQSSQQRPRAPDTCPAVPDSAGTVNGLFMEVHAVTASPEGLRQHRKRPYTALGDQGPVVDSPESAEKGDVAGTWALWTDSLMLTRPHHK